ncbi:Hypothetical_protein [Hexamita inflata]|uniref:Hypothetical_protein n=1 Tax=Hexamita inflata TaxID=28002 RepID=A0AA86QY07_9EUKA|nr:Hypothetical protein HINF_LOCUS49508 [Hexamita inflata]
MAFQRDNCSFSDFFGNFLLKVYKSSEFQPPARTTPHYQISRRHKRTICETFESKTWALAHQCFHFQNGLNPSFMPTQQRPSRALTELLADQFQLIRYILQPIYYIYMLLFIIVLCQPLNYITSHSLMQSRQSQINAVCQYRK